MSPNSQHGNIINTPIYNGSGITTNLVIRANVRHVLLAQNMPSTHREYWEQQIMPIERGMDETDNGEDTRE